MLNTVKLCVILILYFSPLGKSLDQETAGQSQPFLDESLPKLLIILLDGFRWDYYDRQKYELPGFRQFLSEGVQVKWVDPIFPSLSFPSWTTIATGLYPENHGILGNYMLDLGNETTPETVFSLKDNSTMLPKWWQNAEPLWITATKQGRKVFLANWARCEVPFEGIVPTECTGYQYRDVSTKLRENLATAVQRLAKQDFSLAMIYDDLVDHIGHAFGPDSYQLRSSLRQVDTVLQEFLMNIKSNGLDSKLNSVIISDHGMTNTNKEITRYVNLTEYVDINLVYKVVDYGAIVSIAAIPNKTKQVRDQLKFLPNVDVYGKDDIPEEFHYARNPLVLDFLLVAQPGTAIVGLRGDKQIPNDSKASSVQPYTAVHGYHNTMDMKTIFFARGPRFRKTLFVNESVKLEDEYMIFTNVLDIVPKPNNGSWDRVPKILI